jgi:serine protease Do
MKTRNIRRFTLVLPACVLAATLKFGTVGAQENPPPPAPEVGLEDEDRDSSNAPKRIEKRVVIRNEATPGEARKQTSWLGVATEEAPEALTSQLKLNPGVGLVVTYVSEDSPAAKAGIQKNDLLTDFAGQQLVHPEQLRKLVQVRKPGDTVDLTYLREGEQKSVEITLAQGSGRSLPMLGETPFWSGEMEALHHALRDLPFRDAVRGQARALQEQLGNLRIDQKRIREEVQRSLEEARRAVEEALKHARESKDALGPTAKALRDLERAQEERSVTVTTHAKEVRSLVKSDEAGTIVLIRDPKLRLTAHDKQGKLIFDGPIESQEERAKVPAELWQRVDPLLEEISSKR